MADDIKTTAGTGADPVVATDDVGGRHFQWIKLAYGPNDTATIVQTGTGLPVAGPLTDTQLRAATVPISGSITAAVAAAATATLSNVATSTTSATLLASNSARLGAIIHNDADADLLVKLGTTASATSYTKRLKPQETWEVILRYTGRIDGILESSSGASRATELTA